MDGRGVVLKTKVFDKKARRSACPSSSTAIVFSRVRQIYRPTQHARRASPRASKNGMSDGARGVERLKRLRARRVARGTTARAGMLLVALSASPRAGGATNGDDGEGAAGAASRQNSGPPILLEGLRGRRPSGRRCACRHSANGGGAACRWAPAHAHARARLISSVAGERGYAETNPSAAAARPVAERLPAARLASSPSSVAASRDRHRAAASLLRRRAAASARAALQRRPSRPARRRHASSRRRQRRS